MLNLKKEILRVTSASNILETQSVQNLWSGYGEIKRYQLEEGKFKSIIAKHIQLSDGQQHPKGWNTSSSHQRKLKSYQVERVWYQNYAHLTDENCRVPKALHSTETEMEMLIIMEDLNESGYPHRHNPDNIILPNVKSCLKWLANFHAKFMNNPAEGLWPIGTYWHLDTRPDEWDKMNNLSLKNTAKAIDEKLNQAQYQTIIHGDAKLANFCFGNNNNVAAVDFQYVGKGCGMKDVAYFISSCFEEEECEKYEEELLGHYFNELEKALDNTLDFKSLKSEWQKLYKYAWADFYRFLDGWSPGHWKMHDYSQRLTQEVLSELDLK